MRTGEGAYDTLVTLIEDSSGTLGWLDQVHREYVRAMGAAAVMLGVLRTQGTDILVRDYDFKIQALTRLSSGMSAALAAEDMDVDTKTTDELRWHVVSCRDAVRKAEVKKGSGGFAGAVNDVTALYLSTRNDSDRSRGRTRDDVVAEWKGCLAKYKALGVVPWGVEKNQGEFNSRYRTLWNEMNRAWEAGLKTEPDELISFLPSWPAQ